MTPDGSKIYVADTANRITVYDGGGTELDQFGGTGSKLGKLNAPAQMTLDQAGNLWVADRGNNRIQQFGPAGERLLTDRQPRHRRRPVHPPDRRQRRLQRQADRDRQREQPRHDAHARHPARRAWPARRCRPRPHRRCCKYPTLPEPLGPQLTVKILRKAGLLTARNLPVRIGCDTTCSLTATATLVQRGQREGRRQGQEAQGRQAGVDRPRAPEAVDPGGHVEDRAADDLQDGGGEAAQGAGRQEGPGRERCSSRRPRRRGRRRVRRRASWRRREQHHQPHRPTTRILAIA